MPLKVVCGDCKEVLYDGEFKAMSEVLNAYTKRENTGTEKEQFYKNVARCPRCEKVLEIKDMDKKTTV
jgi:phage FluMu protein Com